MKKINFEWETALRILAMLAVGGFVWTQDNQLAAMSLAAMTVVWGVKVYALKTKKYIGKAWLTGILLGISVGFSYLFKPLPFPPFPKWYGDALTYVSMWLSWSGFVISQGTKVFAFATGLYNVLAAKVFEKIEKRLVK